MSPILISILVSLCFGILFILMSFLSKRKDFMLDDYEENDKPDNVRIIEKEVDVIVEKEIVKEVEKVVIDETKIFELEKDINDISNKYQETQNVIKEKSKALKEIEAENFLYKETIDNLNLKIDEKESEKDLLLKLKEDKEISIKKFEKETKNLLSKISTIRKDKETFQKEINDNKKEFDKIIGDRDHFLSIIEKKDKEIQKKSVEINKLKSIKDAMNIKNSFIYEGVDDYGKFYDINHIGDKFSKDMIDKIKSINEEIDEDQFGSYAVNTNNGYGNFKVYDMDYLDQFIESNKNKKTNGKYSIFLIMNNRVYHFEIH